MGFEIQNHVLIRYTEEPDITEITIPEEVTEIKENAFYQCQNLKSVYIPDSVTKIGGSAFFDCIRLEEVRLPAKLTCIEEATFLQCRSLKYIVIPDGVEKIGWEAFMHTNIRELTIPASVKIIENCIIGHIRSKNIILYFQYNQKKTKIIVETFWSSYLPEVQLMEFFQNPCFENFSQLGTEYKIQIAISYYDTDEQIRNYLKQMIKKAVSMTIDTDDTALLNELLQTGFITKKNIDSMIAYAIQHTQETGHAEMQVILMNHKHKHFPETIDISKKLKL